MHNLFFINLLPFWQTQDAFGSRRLRLFDFYRAACNADAV